MKQKVIIFLLVVSLIVNYYAISTSIKYKRMMEYYESEQIYREIYISATLLKNISKDLTMSSINVDELSGYSDLLRQFTYVNISFDNYREITDKLFKFITKIGTNEINIISANKVGQQLSVKSQMLLQKLTMPSNKPLADYEDIETIYKDIISILNEY